MRSHFGIALAMLALLLLTPRCTRPPSLPPQGQEAVDPGPTDVSGTWRFVCCSGNRFGSLELQQDGERLSGTLHEEAYGSQLLQGLIEGNRVLLHSQESGAPLTYQLTFNARCRVMQGTLRGTVIQQVYPEVKLVSEVPPRGAPSCPERELPPLPRCFYTQESAPPPCTGVPYDASKLPPRFIRVCNSCLTDAHCTEHSGGRCIPTAKLACAGNGAKACAYPGEPCHPDSAGKCPFCYNAKGRVACGPLPQQPPSMPLSAPPPPPRPP